MVSPKVLSILKRRDNHYTEAERLSKSPLSSGLLNSASFITAMLTKSGVENKLVEVMKQK